jgi:signal transduction histidine kinase
MQIIIRNLVSNAIKFTNTGGKIELNTNPHPIDDSLIVFSVSDNGIGIQNEKLSAFTFGKKIDSTYGTLKEKGTGLGLSLCLDLVKLIDGRMEIQSQAGTGTTVTIFLRTKV